MFDNKKEEVLGRQDHRTVAVLLLAALCLVSACRRPPAGAAATGANTGAGADVSAYVSPPTVLQADRAGDGLIRLRGQAVGDAEVRLQSPDGRSYSVTANPEGAFSLTLPASSQPRMFAVEAEAAGRVTHAEGALLILPAPGPPAVLTRAGFGARNLDRGGGGVRIQAIDYDGAGGGAVSGRAPAHAPVRLFIDGQTVGSSQADAGGAFTILDVNARAPLSPGPHTFRIEASWRGRVADAEGLWPVAPGLPPTGSLFRAQRESGAYRIDWRLPGGGFQTTVVFDLPQESRS